MCPTARSVKSPPNREDSSSFGSHRQAPNGDPPSPMFQTQRHTRTHTHTHTTTQEGKKREAGTNDRRRPHTHTHTTTQEGKKREAGTNDRRRPTNEGAQAEGADRAERQAADHRVPVLAVLLEGVDHQQRRLLVGLRVGRQVQVHQLLLLDVVCEKKQNKTKQNKQTGWRAQ